MELAIHVFFANCELVDYAVFRPLGHIRPNWDLQWDSGSNGYLIEDGSFASEFNDLIDELERTVPPKKYHDNEDALAEYVQKNLNWGICKRNGIWVNKDGSRLAPSDYLVTLEQGGFHDMDETNLVHAVAGRIHAAIFRGQRRFRDVEESHRRIIGGVLSSILYHRATFE